VLFFPTYAEIVVLYTIFPFQNYTCIGVGMVVQSNEEVGCCIVYWEDPPTDTAKSREHKACLKSETNLHFRFIHNTSIQHHNY